MPKACRGELWVIDLGNDLVTTLHGAASFLLGAEERKFLVHRLSQQVH